MYGHDKNALSCSQLQLSRLHVLLEALIVLR